MHDVYASNSRPCIPAFCALLVSILALAGCVLPGQDRVDTLKTYVVTLADTDATNTLYSAEGDNCPLLVVNTPLSAPGLSTTQMAYTRQDFRLDYFVKHAWADSPARMLTPLLVQSLASTGLFSSVITNPTPVSADIRLDTEVLDFQQHFSEDDSTVTVSLRVTLVALNGRELILNRVFTATEPAPSLNPEGGVIATNRAVMKVLHNLKNTLIELENKHMGKCSDVRNLSANHRPFNTRLL